MYLLRCLFSSIDFKDQKNAVDGMRAQILQQELSVASSKTNFSSILAQSLEALENQIQDDFLPYFAKLTKITPAQEIMISLSLARSVDPKLSEEGTPIYFF